MATTHLPKVYKKVDNSAGTAPVEEILISKPAYIKKILLTNHGTSNVIVTLRDGTNDFMDLILPTDETVKLGDFDVINDLRIVVPAGAVVSVTVIYSI